MIFIKYNTNGKVTFIHYKPFDVVNGLGKTQEELEKEGVLIDSIPEPQQKEGKIATLYLNPTIKELWYKYIDIPKSKEESLEGRVNTIQQVLDDLILGGAL